MDYSNDIISVAVVNFKPEAGDKEANLKRIIDYSVAASKRGADLVLFPEMALLGYDYYISKDVTREEKLEKAEAKQGPSHKALDKTASENDIYIVVGMPEKDGQTLYNTAYVAGPEGSVGIYRKIHPFDLENTWCEKGKDPLMFDTKWGPVSVGICYDTYQFPELMRYYVSKGSRLYLNPTALIEEIPNEGSRRAFINYYAPLLEYGVICNTIYIASSNLTGWDIDHYFGGGSCIVGPDINPFDENDFIYYAGNKDDVQAKMYIETLDLSLATRPLFVDNPVTGVPDYRPEIYKTLFMD